MNETKAHAEGIFQGKVLAFLDQWKDFSASWIAHIASDDKNFKEVREDIASIQAELAKTAKTEDVANIKAGMGRYAGAAAVVGLLASAIIPIILQQLL